jgi:TolA-binding protein
MALLVTKQQHQQECRDFQQQLFDSEDRARAGSFATSQAQGLLQQSKDRIRSLEADVRRLEETVHVQEQHIQNQQGQTRPKVMQTAANQTVYTNPIVSDSESLMVPSPRSTSNQLDVPEQVMVS